MKLLGLLLAALLVLHYWDPITAVVDPPPDFAAAHGGKVILYATDWCGYCAATRRWLATHRIPFVEYDIEKSPEGLRQYRELGGRVLPVLLVRGRVVNGHDPARLSRLLLEE